MFEWSKKSIKSMWVREKQDYTGKHRLLEEDWVCSWNWDTELEDQGDCDKR